MFSKNSARARRLPLQIGLRFMEGRRLSATSHSVEGIETAESQNSGTQAADSQNQSGETQNVLKYDAAPLNDEPLRRRIRDYVRSSRIGRFLAALRQKIAPPPTPEELRLKEKETARKKIEKLRLWEINRCRTLITNRLISLGFKSEFTGRNGSIRVTGPRFEIGRATENEIILRCTYFPDGAMNKINNMADDDVVTALSESVGHPVGAKYVKGEEKFGLRYFIAIAGADGLPSIYSYGDMIKDFPSTAAPLALPFGVRSNGLPLFIDMAGAPHILGAGTTGGGKTNLFHTWICTLISRNSSDIVKIDLLDFKDQGLEFSLYEGVPHLRTGKILSAPEDLREYFIGIEKAMADRYALLKKHGYRKISDYNRRRRQNDRIPFIVIFADEWAQVVNTLGRDEADKVLNKIASQGRAAGIHLAVFTQYPKSDVISTTVTANMSVRIAFYLPTQDQSRVVLQSGRAHTDLTSDQHGRAIVMRGGHEYLTQTALITDRQIRQVVAAVREGTTVSNIGVSIDPEEIIRWSLVNNMNRLGQESVYQQFQERGLTQLDTRALLSSMEQQEFEIDGTLYRVINYGGSRGRVVELAKAGDDTPKSQPATNNQQKEIIADLHRVMDTWEVTTTKDDEGIFFDGDHIWILFDEHLFDETNRAYSARAAEFLSDLQKICAARSALPTPGGFTLNGETVKL